MKPCVRQKSKKFKKGDFVQVIAGKDKDKRGKILAVLSTGKLLVEGVIAVKHVRPNPEKNIEGGRVSVEFPIHHSKVAIVNPTTGKPDRIGFRVQDKNGVSVKVRYFKSNNEVLA